MSLILLPKNPHPSRRALSSLLPEAWLFWPSLPALPTAMIPPRNFLPAPSPHAPPIPRQEPIHPSKYYTFMPESSCVSLSGLSPTDPPQSPALPPCSRLWQVSASCTPVQTPVYLTSSHLSCIQPLGPKKITHPVFFCNLLSPYQKDLMKIVHIPRLHCKNTKHTKMQGTVGPPQAISLLEIFTNDNYLVVP